MNHLHPQVKDLWTHLGLERLRYDYPLDENSLVIDIGAHKGVFMTGIWERYDCRIIGFEKDLELCKITNTNIYALTKANVFLARVCGINDSGNDNNYYSKISNKVSIDHILNFWANDENSPFTINDLVKINVEGDEYEILENIADETLKKIKYLQIQFHILDQTSFVRRYNIQQKLTKTHRLQWCYEFVWESWELKL